MAQTTIRRERALSGRAEAYERFCDQLRLARVRPGQFISQRELVALLDMPLGSVRELIPRLEAAGLLVTVPKRGLQIAPVDLKLIRNAFQVRAMIEREAIFHFTQVVTPEELDALEADHLRMRARAQAPQPDSALDADAQQLDWGFHDRMVDAMGNEILSEMYRVNSLHVRLIALDASQIAAQRVLPAMQEHLIFIAALRRRDAPAAVAALMHHIGSSRQRVIDASSNSPASARALAFA
ncbi:GntR family transcriptional regulator [Caenimonas soli]|uniref:GntR family transcriptional regulator n=1 Tax=Caenimonas soli TaxID=2735555 RepID=UPI0015553ADF|nr:GntR family transcriptional regulator [Caenimonas soli]NPC54557.1 GntR family transcriptional regulator [Caenimonas soli]